MSPLRDTLASPAAGVFANFARPEGTLGRLTGLVVARRNSSLAEWTLDRIDPGPAADLLDIGCGPGTLLARAAERIPHGRLVGVDTSDVMVRQATRRTRDLRGPTVSVNRAAAENLPFPDRSFDAIVAVDTWQHWTAPDAGVAEMVRLARPGARIVVVVRRRAESAGRFDRRRYGVDDTGIDRLMTSLRSESTGLIRRHSATIGGEAHTAVILHT